MQSFVLMGLESAGKSTLFNILTESAASDERNFRGSTVVCREGLINDAGICLVDTPGIRFQSDSETTKLALDALWHSGGSAGHARSAGVANALSPHTATGKTRCYTPDLC